LPAIPERFAELLSKSSFLLCITTSLYLNHEILHPSPPRLPSPHRLSNHHRIGKQNARPFIGMTEEACLNTTHSAILLGMEENRVTYKANEDLYYFLDGKLNKMIAGER
jgi:hypothetical protein